MVVEWRVLKPCWCFTSGMLFVTYGSMTFSRVLAIGDRRDIGLYEVPMEASLFGFGIGMILASFHICGMVLVLRERFKSEVRYVMASGPRCLR